MKNALLLSLLSVFMTFAARARKPLRLNCRPAGLRLTGVADFMFRAPSSAGH